MPTRWTRFTFIPDPDMMRRLETPFWMIPGAVVLALGLVLVGSRQAVAWWVRGHGQAADALEWVEREYHPSASAMSSMREVHRRYAPLREAMAGRLAEQRERLMERAASDGESTASFREEAARWDALAAESHELTWRYLFEMARHLPETEARRFRRELARVVLGLPHGEHGEVSR